MALIVILVAFFALAIGLNRVLGRIIEGRGAPEQFAEEPSDAGGARRPVSYP